MASWQKRTRQHLVWIAAIVIAIASVLATGHRHAEHGASDTPCAVCAVAHHVGTIAPAPVVGLRPPAPIELCAALQVESPNDLGGRRESGRAPPFSTRA